MFSTKIVTCVTPITAQQITDNWKKTFTWIYIKKTRLVTSPLYLSDNFLLNRGEYNWEDKHYCKSRYCLPIWLLDAGEPLLYPALSPCRFVTRVPQPSSGESCSNQKVVIKNTVAKMDKILPWWHFYTLVRYIY